MFYIVISILLFAIEAAYIQVAKKFMIVDRPHHQSSHKGVVIRGGGILFYVAFLLWFVLSGGHYPWTFAGLTIMALVSFVDDIHDISPSIRLFCQFVGIFLFLFQSPLFHQPVHVIFLLMIACVGMVNIYNFMDGINGMTGGYSLIVSIALLYVNTYKINFVEEELLMFIILSIIVFNFFNFRNRAKCFAGDVGSLSIGFIIVFLVLELALKAHSMSWMIFLSVYAVDGGMTLLHRVLLRENLMKPHKKHAYQIMANELNMPHLMVSGLYMILQSISCAWFIAIPNYCTFFIQASLLIGAYVIFMKKFYYLHVKNH